MAHFFEKYPEIDLQDYQYILPEEKIAIYPLPNRDDSKLLVYNRGTISHQLFKNLENYLPEKTLLVLNNTKVIPARIIFQKDTGALIEVFLLQPVEPTRLLAVSMEAKDTVIWECMVRNFRKWKNQDVLSIDIPYQKGLITLNARVLDRDKGLIKLWWNHNEIRFVDVIESIGKTPIPPYFKREPVEEDKYRYQTIYSKHEGAVAAPTAGLHITDNILKNIIRRGHTLDYLTLHVSAGTFQPIKEKRVIDHPMHSEQVVLTRKNIEILLHHDGPIIPVGTTSMRTLESLYWYGVKLIRSGDQDFAIDKLYPYGESQKDLPGKPDAFQAVYEYMKKNELDEIIGHTEIFIFPGYHFRVCNGLITNYHMPKSTLILLVAAFIGKDWRKIYDAALENDYRFLSYGDSSLLFPKKG